MSSTTWQTPTSSSATTSFAGLVRAEVRRYAWRRLPRVGFLMLMGGALLLWLLVVSNEHDLAYTTSSEMTSMVVGPLQAMTALVSLLAMVSAASYVGADGSSGALSQWLTFAPNRSKVFWSKAIAAAAGSAVLATAALMLTLVGATLTWSVLSAGAVVASPVDTLPVLGKGIVFAVLAGIGGYAVSAAFGSTAATLIAAAGYFGIAVARTILRISDAAWRFSPESSAVAYLFGGMRFSSYAPWEDTSTLVYVSEAAGGATLIGWVALALLLSYALFVRREHA